MILDPLTTDLEKKTRDFLSLVEENHSPIKSSLSDVPQLKEAYGELRNLARALDQYARTNRALRYIGLMGTFSSGKSSIVNSLIEQDVRAVDLPPIDDEITILTHPSNRDALMGAHSRGLLKVTTQPVEADLLKGCFLVDTPGSGDPEVREGMVKDFLPICDLILYTFSATSALSISDLSILGTLQDQLGFVPIRFVITRSDEFRKDHNFPLTSNNVNQARIDQFLGHLIARIRAQAPKLDLSPERFFFVDNRTMFGIAELKNSVLSELNSDVRLHSKKIAYFRRGVSNQKEIFEGYLSKLMADVTELEQKAKLNKEHYENNVVLSFQSINDFWRPREGAQTTRIATLAKIANGWEFIQTRGMPDIGSKWLSLPKVRITVEQKSAEVSQDLRRLLLELGMQELRRRKQEIEDQLPDLIRSGAKLETTFVPTSHCTQIVRQISSSMTRSLRLVVEQARAELLSELRELGNSDLTVFASLLEHARRGDLATKDEDYYHDFESMIRGNLSEFLPIVTLFKAAVTSTEARNLIARTGLGEKLDVLDGVDVDVVAANQHTQSFLGSVFATRDSRRRALADSTSALLEKKDLIESALNELNIQIGHDARGMSEQNEIGTQEAETDRSLPPIVDRALSALDEEIRTTHDVWNRAVEEAHVSFVADVKANRLRVMQAWIQRLSGVLGVAVALGILTIAGLLVTGLQSQIGWSLTILSGPFTAATVAVLGWGWKKFSSAKSTLPKTRWRIAKEVVDQSAPRLEAPDIERSGQFGKSISQFQGEISDAIFAFLSKDRDSLLSRYLLHAAAERELIGEHGLDVKNYVQHWSEMAHAMNDWYRPDEFKRNLISDAASDIKQRAIEPALNLFAERLSEVRGFSQRLRDLSI